MRAVIFFTLICVSLGTLLSAQGTLDVTLSEAAPDPAELPIDLTEEGIIDWICWGTVEGQDDRKEGVTLQIGMELINPNPDPGGEPMEAPFWYGTETDITFEWSDGTPTAEAENIDGGLWMPTPGNGFNITAPADPETRVLTLYTGLWEADGQFTASLSDESAPEVEQELLNIAEEDYPNVRVWTITYKAGGGGRDTQH